MTHIRLLFLFVLFSCNAFTIPHYYCTAADDRFYQLLLNLIGSIHCNDPEIGEIAVYDLGLKKGQRERLKRLYKVTVNQLELTNPDLLTPIVTSPNGRIARGCFSWKHVVLKQGLEKFPYFLYLDTGVSITNNPDDIFKYINEHGYFFIDSRPGHIIADRITDTVITQIIDKEFPEKKELILDANTWMQTAGVQGISRKILDNYVLPLYEYSKNLSLYLDDKTARLGYGAARHDQTLSSVLLTVKNLNSFQQGFIDLEINNEVKTIHCLHTLIEGTTHIFVSQSGINYEGGFIRFLKKEPLSRTKKE